MDEYLKLEAAVKKFALPSTDVVLQMAIDGQISLYKFYSSGSFSPLGKNIIKSLLFNGEYFNGLLYSMSKSRFRRDRRSPTFLSSSHELQREAFTITLNQILVKIIELEQALTENSFPPELKIAVETWREIFGAGIRPILPPATPKTKKGIVLDHLRGRDVTGDQADRIAAVIVSDKSGSKSWEFIEPPCARDETDSDHPHYSKPLNVAMKMFIELYPANEPRNHTEAAKEFLCKLKPGLDKEMQKRIITMTNPVPKRQKQV